MKTFFIITLIPFLVLMMNCTSKTDSQSGSNQVPFSDPLPSWNAGEVKSSILEFVTTVTDSSSDQFIPVRDRIATFDNDGTLWSEQPAYFQLLFVMDKIREMEADHPEWRNTQPFQAVLENDMNALANSGMKGVMELLMKTHAGMTTEEFERSVEEWLQTARHPLTDKPYTKMVYQPMLELLDYLRRNGFKTYIVSGGGIEFMRPWVEEVYGIPRDQVVGSSIKTEFAYTDGIAQINRLPEIDFIDDKAGKPVGIWRFIGRQPVFAVGNSDGDLQMLQFVDSKQPSFCMYIHHTDSIREWAYDRNSPIGKLDIGIEEASEKGWRMVSMKDDWNQIYPSDNR